MCKYADKQKDGKTPLPIRIILDDFATNVVIENMPRILSTIRARNISIMLVLQSQAQLERAYGEDAKTIICNCDSYCYLGGNDIETAKELSIRLDIPITEVLYMPIGQVYIFRRGELPLKTSRYNMKIHKDYPLVYKKERIK